MISESIIQRCLIGLPQPLSVAVSSALKDEFPQVDQVADEWTQLKYLVDVLLQLVHQLIWTQTAALVLSHDAPQLSIGVLRGQLWHMSQDPLGLIMVVLPISIELLTYALVQHDSLATVHHSASTLRGLVESNTGPNKVVFTIYRVLGDLQRVTFREATLHE